MMSLFSRAILDDQKWLKLFGHSTSDLRVTAHRLAFTDTIMSFMNEPSNEKIKNFFLLILVRHKSMVLERIPIVYLKNFVKIRMSKKLLQSNNFYDFINGDNN